MDLKKLFKNNDAVSPVIGVILMVAITVILAAAIGSSVFGQGTTKPAPQANIGITAGNISSGVPSVTFEHLGGDPIHFESLEATKVTASLNGNTSVEIDATGLKTMSVGDARSLVLANITNTNPADTVSIKIIDVKTNQLISNKDVRF
jgi:archaeal type IV pilus assembly protein PilA